MVAKNITLFRLSYPYGKSQIYFPTDLLLIAGRLKKEGVKAIVYDLNLYDLPDSDELSEQEGFGIGVIGAPYIPGARNLALNLYEETGKPVGVGGQPIEKLPPEHFDRIFGGEITQVRSDVDLEKLLGISSAGLPSPYESSILPALDSIPQEDLPKYLAREFGFFISQGCKFTCDFCAAEKRMPERYRSNEVVEEELVELTKRAKRHGIDKMAMYLTALDLFQSPKPLTETLEVFARTGRDNRMEYELRGLARIDSFLKALEQEPSLEKLIRESGVGVVGFGVDGTTEKIWRSQHKAHKDLSEVDRALDRCKYVGITPELLMVMGFPEDNLGSVAKNYFYTVAKAFTHGAVSRPYLAKNFVPGNNGWTDAQYEQSVEKILDNPELFTNLDFATFGSSLTHPRRFHRLISNIAYAAITLTLEPFGRNATYPLMPQKEQRGFISRAYNKFANAVNKVIPFDK